MAMGGARRLCTSGRGSFPCWEAVAGRGSMSGAEAAGAAAARAATSAAAATTARLAAAGPGAAATPAAAKKRAREQAELELGGPPTPACRRPAPLLAGQEGGGVRTCKTDESAAAAAAQRQRELQAHLQRRQQQQQQQGGGGGGGGGSGWGQQGSRGGSPAMPLNAMQRNAAMASFLNIVVRDQAGAEVHFRTRHTTKMDRVFDAWATFKVVPRDSVRFMFDGQEMDPDLTPAFYQLENDDVIDALIVRPPGPHVELVE